jgi:hypothetical protein
VTQDIFELPGSQQSISWPETACRDGHPYFEGFDTARRLRPFARRRFKTARPPRVFIRARKPCSRNRRIRLG